MVSGLLRVTSHAVCVELEATGVVILFINNWLPLVLDFFATTKYQVFVVRVELRIPTAHGQTLVLNCNCHEALIMSEV